MNFDFHQQYKDYPNTELLKIVKRPANYQPAAVAAATQILSERQVIDDEVHFVEQYYQEMDSAASAKKEKLDGLKRETAEFFKPILHPSEKLEPTKWVNILLLVIAIQYLWLIFNTVRLTIAFFECSYCSIDITLLAQYLAVAYVPVIFFLLYKQRRWGWILLFADSLLSLISKVSQTYIFFRYQSIHHGDTTSFLLSIGIEAAFVFFLWREPIANHFGIAQETKKKTVLVTIVVALLLKLFLYLN